MLFAVCKNRSVDLASLDPLRPKSQKARILILGKLPPPYIGPAIATQILLQSRLAREFELCHINTATHSAQTMIGKWSLGKIWSNFRLCLNLVCVLVRNKPDLALVPISQATDGFIKDSIFMWLCRAFGSRVLLQLRGSNLKNWLSRTRPTTRAYVEYVITKTAGVIVLGDRLRYLFEDYFSQDRIFVAPNGGDYDIPAKRIDSQGSALTILSLSNLKRSKGIEDVVAAAAILKQKSSIPFEFHVVGEWSDNSTRENCDHLMRELAPPVTFHDAATGDFKWQYLADADVFLFVPRAPEGHPWVIVEAMAAGLPIISTDKGAITESVANGVNGFIIESGSPEQIADKLELLISDADLRYRMGKASRARYEEQFTESKMVERYTAAFHSILSSDTKRSLRTEKHSA